MKEIKHSNWGEFEFNKVFSFQRGERLITLDQVNGEIPYISSSKTNNGIDNYIRPPDYMVRHKNALTLNNSGSVGYCFYHPYEFVCSDHCTVIKIKDPSVEMSLPIALYLKPVIEMMKSKYSFAREISNFRLNREKISLPIGRDGIPDWKGMEVYINDQAKNVVFNNQNIKSVIQPLRKIEVEKWEWFPLSKIFEIKKGKRLTKENMRTGSTPFIGSTEFNNGITTYIDRPAIHKANTISVTYNGSVAEAFYQTSDFWASDDVNVLYPKFVLNPYIAMFLITIIRMEKYRYSYGRKWHLDRMRESQIKLPMDSKGNPDWQYMESYITGLPYSSNI